MAETVEFLRGDAVIVTGTATGRPPRAIDVRRAKSRCGLPVYLGSGVTAKNLPDFYTIADGFIVGSEFKKDGVWSEPVDPRRVQKFMAVYKKLGR